MDPITNMWKKAGYNPPKITSGLNGETGEQFLVLEDDSTIIRLMDKNGNIFVVAAFRCTVNKSADGRKYYLCGNPMHPVTCSKLENPRDKFALDQLKPFVFP